jgi:hypothetical protein
MLEATEADGLTALWLLDHQMYPWSLAQQQRNGHLRF